MVGYALMAGFVDQIKVNVKGFALCRNHLYTYIQHNCLIAT